MEKLLNSACLSFWNVQSVTHRLGFSQDLLAFVTRFVTVFEACSDAYLSSDASNHVIVPCGASECIICEKASKWESNGTALCDAVGFTVQTADDLAEEPCHGSNATLEPMVPSLVETDNFELCRDLQPVIGETTKAHMVPFLEPLLIRHFALLQHSVQTADDSAEEILEQQVMESGSSEKTQNLAWFQDLGQQVREMKLVWVIFRVLLTVVADAVHIIRWRNQLQRLRMIQLHARRL